MSHLSQTLLSTLDAILGCSESSKAIAAIVTLIRKEFRESEQQQCDGDSIGIGDLLVGTVGFAMLQRWGRKNTDSHIHSSGGDAVVWDVVVLDNGTRADVIGTRELASRAATTTADSVQAAADHHHPRKRRASFVSLDGGDIGAVERVPPASSSTVGRRLTHFVLSPEQQHRILSDEDLHFYIMQQLPRGCRASIRTETISARTITVDILDDENAEIAAPPGTRMIAENFHLDEEDRVNNNNNDHDDHDDRQPKRTVVFRTAFNNNNNEQQSADVQLSDQAENGVIDASRTDVDDNDQRMEGSGMEAGQALVVGTRAVPSNNGAQDDYNNHDGSVQDRTIIEMSASQGSAPQGPGGQQQQQEEEEEEEQQQCRRPATDNNTRASSRRARGDAASGQNLPSLPIAAQKSLYDHKNNNLGKRSLKSLANRVKQNSSGGEKTEGGRKRKTATTPNSSPLAPNRSSSAGAPTKQQRQRTRTAQIGSNAASFANRPVQQSPLLEKGLPSRINRVSNSSRPVKSQTEVQNSDLSYREKNKIAQGDAYSIMPTDGGGGVPLGHVRSSSAISMTTRSDAEVTVSLNGDNTQGGGGRRSSAISVTSENNSIILAPPPHPPLRGGRSNNNEDTETIQALHRDGFFPGIFPEKHLVQNVRRFCRFSVASYGPSALKMMGVHCSEEPPIHSTQPKSGGGGLDDHGRHGAFSTYAGLPPSSVLLSSFEDPEGGSNAAGETNTGFPLVHYLCIDHESKAVVLTLRGTWGFEDVLTDMTCDYDELEYLGRSWKVHKGMHASARRLLHGGSGRVMVTIRAALDEYPGYGVVFCGHSLGGGVAALLATMISKPNDDTIGTSFVTASPAYSQPPKLLLAEDDDSGGDDSEKPHEPSYFLPAGRPIHVYAYGPPAVMSPLLRRATRGLITTIVNGQDMVPSLSLGMLHDMHAVSVMFKGDASSAKRQIRSRFWEGLRHSIINKFYVDQPPLLLYAGDGIGEDAWAWKTLNMLREEMQAPKLVPPGEVFVVDTSRVLQRDPFASSSRRSSVADASYPRLGRPATRVQLRFIRSVEVWFGELRFGSGMFADHNPARYEANIAALARGVLDF